jgi:hypothetical protein
MKTFFIINSIAVSLLLIVIIFEIHNKQQQTTVINNKEKQIKTDWELLQIALIWQESKGNPKARNGDAVGILQITPIYVAEANRISKNDTFVLSDRESVSESLKMFEIVQGFHNPEKDIKKAIKLHNPTAGDKYYQDVIDKFRMLKFNQYKY